MKTTIDIGDALFSQAKRLAAREGTTIRALVEQGLRHQIAERKQQAGAGFKLRKVGFRGQGLQPGVRGFTWDQLRDLSYGSRGA